MPDLGLVGEVAGEADACLGHGASLLNAWPGGLPCPWTRAAGLDGLRIHDLRHTAVALWIAAGANPKEVAARAGHASVSFTLDRYGNLYPEADLSLRERLEAIWSASGGRIVSPRGPSAAPAGAERRRGPVRMALRRVDLRFCVVGVTGLEPVTSSL